MRTKVVVELITGNYKEQILSGLVMFHRWTTRQIYWEIHNYPFLEYQLVIKKCHHEKVLRKQLIKCKLIFHTDKTAGGFYEWFKNV